MRLAGASGALPLVLVLARLSPCLPPAPTQSASVLVPGSAASLATTSTYPIRLGSHAARGDARLAHPPTTTFPFLLLGPPWNTINIRVAPHPFAVLESTSRTLRFKSYTWPMKHPLSTQMAMRRGSLTSTVLPVYLLRVNPRCSFGEAVLGQCESAGPCLLAGRCA